MEYTKEHISLIQSAFGTNDIQINVIDSETTQIEKYLPVADVLIMSPLDHLDLVDFSIAKKLKWVHQTAAGASGLSEKLRNSDIILTNSSGVHPIPIAEQIFTFILMLSRQFFQSFRNQIEKKSWVQEGIAANLRELDGSTIGIVGYGRIGKRVAKLAKGFGMKVIALTRDSSLLSDELVDTYYQRSEVNKLLKEADYVVNCLPMTEQTESYFDREKFSLMKSSAYFINIGRGATVVEEDLIAALKEGIIAGAGLDVFSQEPLPDNSELWDLRNVIITPHYAGWTPKYIDRVVDIFIQNMTAFIKGENLPNLVDKARGY